MIENRKDVEAPVETQARVEWQRPVLRKLDAVSAEASTNATTDLSAFS